MPEMFLDGMTLNIDEENNMTIAKRASQIVLALLLAWGAAFTSAPVQAQTVYNNTNGTGACRATKFAGQTAFYYNYVYIWNGSDSNQYLTCVLPLVRVSNTNSTIGTSLSWSSVNMPGTVTCTAQTAVYFSGSNHIAAGSTLNTTLAANDNAFMSFGPLARTFGYQNVNIICNVPPGFRLGLIQHRETL